MSGKAITSPEGLKLVARMRDICTRLPEVEEKIDEFGHTSFRVKDKPFVMLGEGGERGPSLALKTLPTTQEVLLQSGRFKKTPYIGQHGWSSITAERISDWEELESLVLEGYLRTAPKRLAKLVDLGSEL